MGIKGMFAGLVAKAVDERVNGAEITENLDVVLDEQLGERASEKIQRGQVMNLLCEMQEGLYSEGLMDLAEEYELRAAGIRTALTPEDDDV
ncbi:MAG: hypothetical protein B6242_12285 [Anaerolineaceae bacterium 4572_78]|nr:MAG: hypothetical protein B6242_12285 [Anaerolineaceae bacterium 4572_78]